MPHTNRNSGVSVDDMMNEIIEALDLIKNTLPTSEIQSIKDHLELIYLTQADIKEDLRSIKKQLLDPEDGIVVRVNKNTDFRKKKIQDEPVYSKLIDEHKELILESAKKALYYGIKEFTHDNYGFSNVEIQKLKRIYDYAISDSLFDVSKQRRDFVKFVDKLDKRRDTNFNEVFPQLKEFYVRNKKE